MSEVEVDPQDEADDAATEILLAGLFTQAFLPTDPLRLPESLRIRIPQILQSAAGQSLRSYLQRVSFRTLQAFQAKPEQYEVVNEVIPLVANSVSDQIGNSIVQILQAPSLKPEKYVQESGLTSEAAMYKRITDSLESASRMTVTRSREEAKLELAIRMGATGKVWRTRRDSRVRTSHGDLEGDFRPMGEAFVTIRGARLQFPGDPTAPLDETMRCRCRLSYRMEV